MENNLTLVPTAIIAALLIIIAAGCTNNKASIAQDCSLQLKHFDDSFERSRLPIIENNNSLCYGMNMATDFANLDPDWAVGKLVSLKKESVYSLSLEGQSKSTTIYLPLSDQEASALKVGSYYRIDMNNICRYFFMLADSRYPSWINSTFIMPEQIECKQT